MEERLRCHIETDHGIGVALGLGKLILLAGEHALCHLAEFHTHVFAQGMLEVGGTHQVEFLLHLLADAFCLHLGGSFQLLGETLGGEAVVVDLLDAVVQIGVILHHHERRRVEELEEALLHGLPGSEFRHHLDALALVLGELVFDAESSDGIDFITEEIDAERKFAAVGIDIDDASTHGKLARLVDIVHLLELEIAQLMHHIYLWNLLTDRKFQNLLIQMLFRHHEFGKGIGIRNDKNGVACRQSGKHFGSEYLVGGIALAILHGTAIAGWEEEHALLPQHLREVVVEISRLVGIIEHEKHRPLQPRLHRTEKHGG